jgi:hypothetical protein
LSDFLIKLCESQSRGNASVLARLEREWIHQEKINQAINHENPPQSPVKSLETMDSLNTGYLLNLQGHSDPMYTPDLPYTPPHVLIGHIDDEWGVVGSGPNGWGAYYETTGWYYYNGVYRGGEALSWGDASQPYNGLAEFHITAKKGSGDLPNPPWHNYIVVSVSNTGDWEDWHPVHYVEVHSSDWQDYEIGNINIEFKYITVMSWCPYAWPVEKSSLYVDNVYYIEDYRQVTLSISSGEGGSTDPSGDIVVWQYQQPKVTATANPYYAFDYWVIDGTSYDSTNPIWMYMDDDHTLQAVFSPITDAWLTVYTRDQLGNPLDVNIYVDSNWVGVGSASVYLTLGTHYIDADGYVWDEYWQTYVFPVSGLGAVNLTGDTTVTVYYTY